MQHKFQIKAWSTSSDGDEIILIAIDKQKEVYIDIVISLRDPNQVKGLRTLAENAQVGGAQVIPIAMLLNHLLNKSVNMEYPRAA